MLKIIPQLQREQADCVERSGLNGIEKQLEALHALDKHK